MRASHPLAVMPTVWDSFHAVSTLDMSLHVVTADASVLAKAVSPFAVADVAGVTNPPIPEAGS